VLGTVIPVATTPEAIIPVLVYEDIQGAYDFLVEAFGFTPGSVDADGDGNPVHGEVEAQGQTFWLDRALPDKELGMRRRAVARWSGWPTSMPTAPATGRATAGGSRPSSNRPAF
jgi:uncharacterized glyoxalase superfamily protein PhnB